MVERRPVFAFDEVIQAEAAHRTHRAGILAVANDEVLLALHLAFHPFDQFFERDEGDSSAEATEVQFGFVLAEHSADWRNAMLELLNALRMLFGGREFRLALLQFDSHRLSGCRQFLRFLPVFCQCRQFSLQSGTKFQNTIPRHRVL